MHRSTRDYLIWPIVMIVGLTAAFGQVNRIHNLQKSLRFAKDSTQYVDIINKISILSYEQDIDSTLFYASLAKGIATRLQYAQGIADATNNLGVVFDVKGNVQLALRYYNDAYNQYVALGDTSNIIQTLMNIGLVYSINKNDKKALHNLNRAMAIGYSSSKDSMTAMLIYNYILFYPEKFTKQRKADLITKVDETARKYHDSRMWIANRQLKANDLIADKQTEKGLQLLQTALDSALTIQAYYLSMDILIGLGDHYFSEDEKKGIQFYKQALDIADKQHYRLYARDICKKLYSIYIEKNNRPTAFIYSQRLLKIYEDQAELDQLSGIDYIDYALKDQQLASEQLKSEYNSRMLWLASIVCFLAILSLFFLWRNLKLTRKTNNILTLQFRQLESTSSALEASNQNYAKLIKVVAHDLRNPLAGIHTMSLMLQDGSLNKEEADEFVALIHEACKSCLNLISDLLQTDFHVTESELQNETIHIAKLLQQVVKLLSFRAAEKNQQLVLDNVAQGTIIADQDKILRVFNNLIVNAIKFSPQGAFINVTTEPTEEGVIISIEDRGIGIPQDTIAKLFDPFTSAKRKGTAGEQPFGLGLYISKQIVEAHHGRIWLQSEVGKGTVFFVFLPWNRHLSHTLLNKSEQAENIIQ